MTEYLSLHDIKNILDPLYADFDFKGRIPHDPIKFPARYKNKKDIEIAAFIASSLAYGRVGLFMGVVEKILSIMGQSPYGFIEGMDIERAKKLLSGVNYRFNRSIDIVCMLYILSWVIRVHGSIERLFIKHYRNQDIGLAISGAVNAMLDIDTTPVYGKNIRPNGLRQLFPSPKTGSACKRMNLFLRWMVRDKDIDFGLWRGIPKSALVIPLDVHIGRVSRCLGFTKRRSNDWKAALEITEALRALDPEDPLKYDFALCHTGISGVCGKDMCRGCALFAR